MVPSHFKLQYSKAQIDAACARLGMEITVWADSVYRATNKDVVAVPVLRGGIFFFADLAREIKVSVEIAPGRSRFYAEGEVQKRRDRVEVMMEGVPSRGRSILVIDDICDSGESLFAISGALKSAGAVEVKTAVLIRRVIENPKFIPDWVGYDYTGVEWFVGYGLEERDRFRNLQDVYTLPPGSK